MFAAITRQRSSDDLFFLCACSACDRLRCTECNFEVLCFGHQIWEPNTDYIFLRNNAPDPSKLSARLRPSPGGLHMQFGRVEASINNLKLSIEMDYHCARVLIMINQARIAFSVRVTDLSS